MDPNSVQCGQVDMDMEDENDEGPSTTEEKMPEKSKEPPLDDDAPPGIRRTSQATHLSLTFVGMIYSNFFYFTMEDHRKDGERWDAEGDHSEVVRHLGQSKWSEDQEEHDTDGAGDMKGSLSVLSGLGQAYGRKNGKSVRWGDKVL